jgi:hypothetical protein
VARFTEKCNREGVVEFTHGVSGLALLALLRAGIDGTAETPMHDAVRRGLQFLRSAQDPRGCFGPVSDPRFVYSHAIATLVMCEAYGMTKDAECRKAAQAGLKLIAELRNPGRAWRYGERPNDNDTSVTAWMLRALAAGRDLGLDVDATAITDGLRYIDDLTDPATGRTGYITKGEAPVRPEGLVESWPPQNSESLTALAIVCRIVGEKEPQRRRRFLDQSAPRLLRTLPRWDPVRGTIDMYYWYYGSLASYEVGKDLWSKWDAALRKAATTAVRKIGCPKGSFDPLDPWGEEGGRIYSTAMMALALEAAYGGERRLK